MIKPNLSTNRTNRYKTNRLKARAKATAVGVAGAGLVVVAVVVAVVTINPPRINRENKS
jgi:hypothetical protein